MRFIAIGLVTFLFVTSAVFLRKIIAFFLCGVLSFNSAVCYSFLNLDEVATAGNVANQIDLTGVWIVKGSIFTHDSRGCTLGWIGKVTTDGQDSNRGVEVTIRQSGNQLIIPKQVIEYSGRNSGSYTQYNQGKVSGNRVTQVTWADTFLGRVTTESVGTISSDGNTITGELFCKNTSGSATAKGTFISTRKHQFTLTKATTYDAKSITIDYTIGTSDSSSNASSQPIHFEVYRSATEDSASASHRILTKDIQIGEGDITNETNLPPNKHRVRFALQNEDALKPNTAFPYVVVIGTYNGKQSITYFRKWMLGAISHGFSRWNQPYANLPVAQVPIPINRAAQIFEFYSGNAFTPHDNLTGIPDWETNMAKDLKNYDGYDDVIEFDWTKTCAVEKSGMAVQAGGELREKVLDWISNHRKQHVGDVVDIHLIGHSRGTVVVTQALNGIMPVLLEANFGSYVELTLLDPHPANNELEQPWASFGTPNGIDATLNPYRAFRWAKKTGSITLLLIGIKAYEDILNQVTEFQRVAHDPYLDIPENVNSVDVWYQHTKADDLGDQPDQEWIMNLWGLRGVNVIRNKGGVPVHFYDLTTGANFGKKSVGHNQVPNEYEELIVKTGKLNRSI